MGVAKHLTVGIHSIVTFATLMAFETSSSYMNEHTLSSLITSYIKNPECRLLSKDESDLARASHQHLHLISLVLDETLEPLFDDFI